MPTPYDNTFGSGISSDSAYYSSASLHYEDSVYTLPGDSASTASYLELAERPPNVDSGVADPNNTEAWSLTEPVLTCGKQDLGYEPWQSKDLGPREKDIVVTGLDHQSRTHSGAHRSKIHARPQSLPNKRKSHVCTLCTKRSPKCFTTNNDLDRHMRTVHGLLKEGDKYWKCQVAGCVSAQKCWPRLDNFKQHVLRMHGLQNEPGIERSFEIFRTSSEAVNACTPAESGENLASAYNNLFELFLPASAEVESCSQTTRNARPYITPTVRSRPLSPGDKLPVLPRKQPMQYAEKVASGGQSIADGADSRAPNLPLPDLAAVGKIFGEPSRAVSPLAGWLPTSNFGDRQQLLDDPRRRHSLTLDEDWFVSMATTRQPATLSREANSSHQRHCRCNIVEPSSDPHSFCSPSARSMHSLRSFRSDGERSFVGHSCGDDDEGIVLLLDDDEQKVAALISRAVLTICYKLTHEYRQFSPQHNGRQKFGGHQGTSSGQQGGSSARTQVCAGASGFGKRRFVPEENQSNPNSDGKPPTDPGLSTKRVKINPGAKPFACPFNKAFPFRYSKHNEEEIHYRSCGSCLLRDISILKQHLYRVHRGPEFYCARCYAIFESRFEQDTHWRQGGCQQKPCLFSEKMTHEMYLQVKRTQRDMSPTEIWFEIFKALFPGRRLPSSPYTDDQESICHQVSIFRTLGPFGAEFVYQNLHLNPGGVPLPGLTQAIVHEAYDIFAAEVAERRLNIASLSIPPASSQRPGRRSWQAAVPADLSARQHVPDMNGFDTSSNPFCNLNASQQPSDSGIDIRSSPFDSIDNSTNRAQQPPNLYEDQGAASGDQRTRLRASTDSPRYDQVPDHLPKPFPSAARDEFIERFEQSFPHVDFCMPTSGWVSDTEPPTGYGMPDETH